MSLEPVRSRRLPDGPFRDALQEHGPRVWRSLRYLGVPESALTDASEEVFVAVHRHMADLSGGATLETCIYRICLGVARVQKRRAHGRCERTLGTPTETQPQRSSARLWAALAALDDNKRDVFVMREIEEMPMGMVAKVIGCPLPTAYALHRAARYQLKRVLRREGVSEERR